MFSFVNTSYGYIAWHFIIFCKSAFYCFVHTAVIGSRSVTQSQTLFYLKCQYHPYQNQVCTLGKLGAYSPARYRQWYLFYKEKVSHYFWGNENTKLCNLINNFKKRFIEIVWCNNAKNGNLLQYHFYSHNLIY